jgi:hypothetical protein
MITSPGLKEDLGVGAGDGDAATVVVVVSEDTGTDVVDGAEVVVWVGVLEGIEVVLAAEVVWVVVGLPEQPVNKERINTIDTKQRPKINNLLLFFENNIEHP